MSQDQKRKHERRRQLLDAIAAAGRESSTATVLFHAAIAAKAGLAASDTKTLDVLMRHGPLTAGELGEHTGLAGPSITSLIDRLEAKKLVRRTADAADRRRVLVEPVLNSVEKWTASFGPIGRSFESLLESYSDGQLETILDFMQRSAAMTRELTAAMAHKRNRRT